jgi:hypothetical protein
VEGSFEYIDSRGQPSRGGPPAWGLSVGLTTPHRKKKLITKYHKKPRTWTDSLDKRPKRKKMYVRFGTWNVRSVYRPRSLRAVAEEISKVTSIILNLRA